MPPFKRIANLRVRASVLRRARSSRAREARVLRARDRKHAAGATDLTARRAARDRRRQATLAAAATRHRLKTTGARASPRFPQTCTICITPYQKTPRGRYPNRAMNKMRPPLCEGLISAAWRTYARCALRRRRDGYPAKTVGRIAQPTRDDERSRHAMLRCMYHEFASPFYDACEGL